MAWLDVDGSTLPVSTPPKPVPLPAIGAASPVNFGNLSNPLAQAGGILPPGNTVPAVFNSGASDPVNIGNLSNPLAQAGGILPPGNTVPGVPSTPAPPVAPGAAPSLQVGPSQSDILNTPQYRQLMENVELWRQQQQASLDLAKTQAGSYDAFYAQQEALARSQGEQTYKTQQQQQADLEAARAREFGQVGKYIRERGAGSGNAGGQVGFEQGNLQFGYNQFLKGAALNAENAKFAYDYLLKEIDLSQQQHGIAKENTLADIKLQQDNLALGVSQRKGDALMQVMNQMISMYFRDGPQGWGYYGPGGQFASTAQAQASLPSGSSGGQGALPTGGLEPGTSTPAAQIPAPMTWDQALSSVNPQIAALLREKGR